MVNFNYNLEYFPRYIPSFFSSNYTETSYLEVSVYPIFYKQNVVEWNIPAEWGSCKFDVYSSASELGPWRKVTIEPTAEYFYKDKLEPELSKFSNTFYKVECILPSGQRITSKPITWDNKQSTWVNTRAKEIQRRESILLRKFVGVKTLFFRRKRFGKRCPNCWDPISNSITKDKCQVCLGTGFEGGYFGGYETLLQYDPTPSAVEFSYQGMVEHNSITAWTTSYPSIESLDIILRVPDMRLYRVGTKQTTELQTVAVRQILQLVEIGKNKVEFELVKKLLPDNYVL